MLEVFGGEIYFEANQIYGVGGSLFVKDVSGNTLIIEVPEHALHELVKATEELAK